MYRQTPRGIRLPLSFFLKKGEYNTSPNIFGRNALLSGIFIINLGKPNSIAVGLNLRKQTLTANKILEKEWWQLLKSGNKSILSRIYSTYIDQMFGYGMSIIPNKDFIKDCIQEVFVDLWKYRSTLSNTDNIKLYLYKSLRNKIYNLRAKEIKHRDLHKQNPGEGLVLSYENILINNQRDKVLQHKLANSIQKLPERQREVIRHLYFESHSYEETSNLMEINIRSVYTLAWKALSSLRKSIHNVYLILPAVSLGGYYWIH